MVLEASAGDYRFLLQRKEDGTFKCFRTPIDSNGDPANAEELTEWAQLPPMIFQVFTKAVESLPHSGASPMRQAQSPAAAH
jgi:hypothetical protein